MQFDYEMFKYTTKRNIVQNLHTVGYVIPDISLAVQQGPAASHCFTVLNESGTALAIKNRHMSVDCSRIMIKCDDDGYRNALVPNSSGYYPKMNVWLTNDPGVVNVPTDVLIASNIDMTKLNPSTIITSPDSQSKQFPLLTQYITLEFVKTVQDTMALTPDSFRIDLTVFYGVNERPIFTKFPSRAWVGDETFVEPPAESPPSDDSAGGSDSTKADKDWGNVTVALPTNLLPSTVVTTDTDQTITNTKTFSSGLVVSGDISVPGGRSNTEYCASKDCMINNADETIFGVKTFTRGINCDSINIVGASGTELINSEHLSDSNTLVRNPDVWTKSINGLTVSNTLTSSNKLFSKADVDWVNRESSSTGAISFGGDPFTSFKVKVSVTVPSSNGGVLFCTCIFDFVALDFTSTDTSGSIILPVTGNYDSLVGDLSIKYRPEGGADWSVYIIWSSPGSPNDTFNAQVTMKAETW